MSKYKGIFTFDEDNHRYVPLAVAVGIIDTMDYESDSEPTEPLIKDEKIRKAVKVWAKANGLDKLLAIKMAGRLEVSDGSPHLIYISFHADKETMSNLDDRTYYTIAELCGEEEE